MYILSSIISNNKNFTKYVVAYVIFTEKILKPVYSYYGHLSIMDTFDGP